jgi:transcriptional repressor NF-X1
MWNCVQCRTICHLKCLKDWVFKSNKIEEKDQKRMSPEKLLNWSCPHCKFEFAGKMPKYHCYCGKVRDPKPNIYTEPHSCGKLCGRLPHETCVHPCKEICHSSQCPPCEVIMPDESCFCGKVTISRKCKDAKALNCVNVCEKPLNCSKHTCEIKCHGEKCKPCDKKVMIGCFCG